MSSAPGNGFSKPEASGPEHGKFGQNLPDVGDKPHQPLSFSFPKREFGKTIIVKRSFQSQWFIKWQWLHYDQSRDLAFCHTCVMAVKSKKIRSLGAGDLAFVCHGYSN